MLQKKGKHSFLEKPICVDPTGYRTIVTTSKQATAKVYVCNRNTTSSPTRSYVESKKIMEGTIGEITEVLYTGIRVCYGTKNVRPDGMIVNG